MLRIVILAVGFALVGFACAQNNAIFQGGTADGFSVSSYAQLASHAIFNGGNSDGFSISSFAQPASHAVFGGGDGDGFAAGSFAQSSSSAIFQGGDGDGFSSSTGAFGVLLRSIAFLEGPYLQANANMSDALRSNGLLPLSEPYTGLGSAQVGGGGETTTAGLLNIAGATAVVDWVRIELRDATTPSIVRATRQALIRRDGHIISSVGSQDLSLPAAPGSYFVVVRHRNHLGAMSALPITLSAGTAMIDFTLPSTATFGTNALKNVGGKMALWMGDVNFNGALRYTGSGNDRDPVLVRVGSTAPNNMVGGYWPEDVNLNGQVKYTGASNDRDPILVNVGSTTPNNVRTAQLP